jgi:hypothetical protein
LITKRLKIAMAKKPRALRWARTWREGSRDDYTGKDPERPRFYARTYRVTHFTAPTPWYWVLGDRGLIDQGYASTVEEAVDAAEARHARWVAEGR